MTVLHRLRNTPHRALVAGSLVALLAACRSSVEKPTEVGDLLRHAHFAEAVEVAESLQSKAPNDPEANEALRLARTAYLLELGRRKTFADEDEKALDYFLQADRLSPDEWVVDTWIDKTRRKLGEHWLDVAQELSTGEDLDGALEAFERAKKYNPEDRRADEGISYLLVRKNYREGRGALYYKDGISALRDYWLNYAFSRFGYAEKFLGPTDDVLARQKQVGQQKAEERMAVAREFETQGLYFAARSEYRLARILDPENEEAEHGWRRMQDEASAEELLRNADMLIRKGRLDEAGEEVEQAGSLSELQQDRIDVARKQLRLAGFQHLYDAAYDLEQDGKFVEASAAYAELIDVAGYYQDAIARKETLDEFIADAARLYAEYEAAATPEEGWNALRQIELFWPEYRDVEELLKNAPEGFAPPATGAEAAPAGHDDMDSVDEHAGEPGMEESAAEGSETGEPESAKPQTDEPQTDEPQTDEPQTGEPGEDAGAAHDAGADAGEPPRR